MEINKANQILRVAKMYYEEHMSQQQIAEAENTSNSTVSRLLKKAEELGYIEIKVVQPYFSTADLESQIRNKYNLKKVTVMPDLIDNEQALIRDINNVVLDDLTKLVEDNSTLGIAWGKTLSRLSEVADSRNQIKRENVKVVQLNGSASPILKDFDCINVVRAFSKYFSAEGYQVCAPSFVDSPHIAEILKKESQLAPVFDYAKDCDIALFSVGALSEDGVIFNLGCLGTKEVEELRSQNAVGDLCSHFLTRDGSIASPGLDERCMAVTLEEIKNIPERILVVYGNEKKDVVKAVLENDLVTSLYMDESLAKEILK